MKFHPTPLPGLVLIEPEPLADPRGAFLRLWCADDFAAAGHSFRPLQMSASFSHAALTLRGLHWQEGEHGEAKLVRVTAGRIFDVAVDLRPGSATRGRWHGAELSAENRLALLIPPGMAHGLLTLEPRTEVLYAMDRPHVPEAARGARFDDPAFAVEWPANPALLSNRDRTWPDWTPT